MLPSFSNAATPPVLIGVETIAALAGQPLAIGESGYFRMKRLINPAHSQRLFIHFEPPGDHKAGQVAISLFDGDDFTIYMAGKVVNGGRSVIFMEMFLNGEAVGGIPKAARLLLSEIQEAVNAQSPIRPSSRLVITRGEKDSSRPPVPQSGSIESPHDASNPVTLSV